MSNRNDIIDDFYYGRKEKSKASSLSVKPEGKGSALYSYATPIAYKDGNGNIYMTDKKFSSTTSTQQNKLYAKGGVKKLSNDEYKEKLKEDGVYSEGRL